MILSAIITVRLLRRVRWPQIRALLLEEHGGAYTLSYIMVIPLYILLICIVVETTLVILAKFGTNYAAYAGVRSAIVYFTENKSDIARAMAQKAAVKAFVPFANGYQEPGAPSSTGESANQELYLRAARDYGLNSRYENYLRSKYKYAVNHLRVANLRVDPSQGAPQDEPWLKDMTVDIEYDFAFHVPIVGQLIGTEREGEYYYTVQSSARLQSEAPKNKEESLGINYGP